MYHTVFLWLMRMHRAILVTAIVAYGGAACALTNTSFVLDGAGAWATNGGLANVSAVAQPGGVAVSAAAGFFNYAGFLNTLLLRPTLDTDADGLANEVDFDNDADGLGDGDELAGGAFDPVTATDPNAPDSDGDGADDGAEAAAGTNPLDDGMSLRMVSIRDAGGQVEVGWLARQGWTYDVMADTDLTNRPPFTNTLAAGVIASGAAGAPWYALTNVYIDANAPDRRFYRVRVSP